MDNYKCYIDGLFEKLDNKLKKTAVKSRNKLPYTTKNGVHDNRMDDAPDWWTNGFWGGMMWLMYNATGNQEYKITAQKSEQLLDTAFLDYDALHHDVGFMWHLTSGANYRLTGDKKAYNTNMYMASVLFSRFNIDGNFIRAWNMDFAAGWSIIDCMMNIPLLYWASRETGDDRFKKVAMRHADMTICQHVRQDGSVNHIVEHDLNTGEFICSHPGQGYASDSCWTRGSAWAIYGCVLSYIHTGKKEYLDAAVKSADYYIENVKKSNWLSPIDFRAQTPGLFDSTAGVCAACGFVEIAKYVQNKDKYIDAALNIIKATDENFCDYSDDEDAIVLHGSEAHPTRPGYKVDMPIIYGDFFFVEAVLKLKGVDFLIW